MPTLVMLPAPRIMSAPGVVWLNTPNGLTARSPLLTNSVALTVPGTALLVPLSVIRPLDVFVTRPNVAVAPATTDIAPPLVTSNDRTPVRLNGREVVDEPRYVSVPGRLTATAVPDRPSDPSPATASVPRLTV